MPTAAGAERVSEGMLNLVGCSAASARQTDQRRSSVCQRNSAGCILHLSDLLALDLRTSEKTATVSQEV